MALYHLHAKVVSRSSGRSSVAATAYRSGTRLVNERDGVTHDYTRRRDVLHSEVTLPACAPRRWLDRSMPRCDLDRVADIVERFSVEPDGLYMERRVVLAGYGEAKPTNGGRRRILSSDEFDSVECVTLDGEVVWGERGEPVEPGLGGLGASFM